MYIKIQYCTDPLGNYGGPGRAGDAHIEPEDQDGVEHDIDGVQGQGNVQRCLRVAVAAEGAMASGQQQHSGTGPQTDLQVGQGRFEQ